MKIDFNPPRDVRLNRRELKKGERRRKNVGALSHGDLGSQFNISNYPFKKITRELKARDGSRFFIIVLL